MRKFFVIAAVFSFLSLGAWSQNTAPGIKFSSTTRDTLPQIKKPGRDFLMLQFGYTNWLNQPDSVKTKPFAYTFNIFMCYDFPIAKTKLSFAAGLGVSTTSVYLKNQTLAISDTGTAGNDATFVTDAVGYKRYKFNTAYLTAPFELRYYSNTNNRNKGFKAAAGLQIGTLLGGHTKGQRSVSGSIIKEKQNTKRYLSPWNFSATARLGWGNFSVFGSYNLTNVFKDGAGPGLTPMSVGICLTGL